MKKLGLVLAALMMVATFAIAQTTIFSDNMTNFPTGWTLSPTTGWTKTSTKYYSASYSARCDDISNYGNSQNNYMTRSVSLSGYSSASLSFYIWQYTESGYDYVYLQYYSGSTWTTAWSRAGSYQSWAKQTVTIPTTATQVRFWFKSDASVVYTGAFIDDVVLTATASTTPTLAISSTSWAPAAAGGTSSVVNVTNSGSTSVIAYTVASNQSWLTVSSASGSTPGSFTMTAAANSGAARSATVTVTATTAGVTGSPKTIAVSQAAASGSDTYEPNGTSATAYGLTSGNTYSSYIYSSTDIDYYSLNVTTSGTVKVRMTPPSSLDYDLYLYNSSQTQVASSTRGAGLVDSIVYSATAAGTYYVKVIGYNSVYSTSSPYSLYVSFPTGAATPTLAISSTSWAPAAAGGTSSAVNVTNSGSTSVIAYTVSSNQSWLTVSSASGSTPGSFTMTATANTGTTSRTATVTVTATTAGVAGSPKTISVTQAAPGTGGAEWTIMVFMNADNNLESYGIQDFLEMAAASYSSGKINVIVQMDRSSGYVTTYDNWTSCKRFKIANGMTPIASSQLSDIGEQSMGTGSTLSTFANWAIDNYPANRYSLILWDHGDGWYKDAMPETFKGFSNDDSDGSVIGIANGEFATAMAAITSHLGRKLDHIGWDACLMGMWEVLDIAKNYANVANVSEETEGADGWYYTTWLNTLNTTPTTSAIDMGKAIINSAIGMSTMSVVDLTQVPTLNTYVSTFADELMAAKAAGLSSSVSTALTNTQKFSTSYFSYHIDLSDFATKVKAAITTRPTLTTACNNVVSQVTAAVKLYKNTSSYANARGIAIFHNSSSSNYDTDYNSLPICSSTHWDEYLKGQTSASSIGSVAGTLGETRFGSRGATFELAPCVPNPARSAAMLSFQLVNPAQTTLKVYNLNGQLVKTLVDAQLGNGWHDVSWDLTDDSGKQVTAGAYFYKLESGSARDMKRMIVVK